MQSFVLLIFIGSAYAVSHDSTARRGYRSSFLHAAEKDAMTAANVTRESSATEHGDLTCMRNTGGTCTLSSCKSSRGPTVCEEGRCLCVRGTCANAEGACDQRHGKWLGSYSIQLVHPYNPQEPYVGIASDHSIGRGSASLASTPDSGAAWKIALMPEGRVRFQSVSMPLHAMTLYNNRRRRTNNNHHMMLAALKETANFTGSADGEPLRMMELHKEKVVLPDNDDIWPMLVPISSSSPLDVTFQVRPTRQNGGGLEIWDPQTRHVLASGNPEWFAKDHVASKGIAECQPLDAWGAASDCEGRQLVSFDPELPVEATPYVSRADIVAISGLKHWQSVLLMSIFFCCFCGIGCTVLGGMVFAESQIRLQNSRS